ncbi:MFS transporter [Bacilliculturomica massiliensis]|uniref:MFS transporter n=1 Tax=Bacilliculturomica massiliensis TaxID=1917867 RepID=UPI0010306DC3|nr:MFS transporter [Bacilliculturomica massiliensis]
MRENKVGLNVYVALLFLGIVFSVAYSVPYIKAVFYDGMLELTGVSNAKLGVLMTIYGLGEVLTPGIGGILARKFNYIGIIGFSSVGTIIACLLMALFPSYTMTLFVWMILVFSTLFMVWGTWFKTLRLLADDKVQGTMNGVFYGMCGIGYLLVNSVSLYAYGKFAATDPAAGMKAVFVSFAAVMAVCTLLAVVVLKKVGIMNSQALEEDDGDKVSLIEDMKGVAKYRSVWYFGLTLFCMYSTNIAIQYFTPYFTDVLGMTVVFSGAIAIVRQYGMKIVGSPLGGIFADKIGSISKLIIAAFFVCALMIGIVIVLPPELKTLTVIMVIIMVASLANNLAGGVQYAIPVEAGLPMRYHASAIGFGSAIGFSPDLFQHVLFGYWMDKYGNQGYTYIFVYGVVTAVIGIVILMKFLREKAAGRQSVGQEAA